MPAERAFRQLESIRHRLPRAAVQPANFVAVSNLLEIADQFEAFFFDAFGVLNVGKTAIANAPETIAALRKMQKQVFVVTNASAFQKSNAVEKFRRLGFDFSADEIITSRDALFANVHADGRIFGAIGMSEEQDDLSAFKLIFQDESDFYARAEIILFLTSMRWNSKLQQTFIAEMKKNPRPIHLGNPDLIAPQGNEMSIEAGSYVLLLEDEIFQHVHVYGKPFAAIFATAAARVKNFKPEKTLMLGDTLHTDILGANAFGIQSALVTGHGFLQGLDFEKYIARSGIVPNFIMESI